MQSLLCNILKFPNTKAFPFLLTNKGLHLFLMFPWSNHAIFYFVSVFPISGPALFYFVSTYSNCDGAHKCSVFFIFLDNFLPHLMKSQNPFLFYHSCIFSITKTVAWVIAYYCTYISWLIFCFSMSIQLYVTTCIWYKTALIFAYM